MSKQKHGTADTLNPFASLARKVLPVPRAEADERDRKWREEKTLKRQTSEQKAKGEKR